MSDSFEKERARQLRRHADHDAVVASGELPARGKRHHRPGVEPWIVEVLREIEDGAVLHAGGPISPETYLSRDGVRLATPIKSIFPLIYKGYLTQPGRAEDEPYWRRDLDKPFILTELGRQILTDHA